MLKTIAKQFKQPKGILGRWTSSLMQKKNLNTYSKLFTRIDISEDQNVFEIGYGHGLGIKKIINEYNCNVSGIDFSKLMYKQANKFNQKEIRNKKVNLQYGDFLQCNIPTESFDLIFCINVVYFWNDLQVPFSKIRQSLKPNGTFAFFLAHMDDLIKLKFTKTDIFNKHSIEYVEEELKRSGFTEINHHFNKGYYVLCK